MRLPTKVTKLAGGPARGAPVVGVTGGWEVTPGCGRFRVGAVLAHLTPRPTTSSAPATVSAATRW
jgi:hypothetical protein